MTVAKRWAFWPLLALVCAMSASAVSNPGRGSTPGAIAGLALSVPMANWID